MKLTLDIIASLAMGACALALLAVRAALGPRASYRRVTQQGASFILGGNLMHAGYWMLQPLVRWCSRNHISPTSITWCSLVPALLAAAAAASGRWGIAAWCLLASALLDVLDGAVARTTGQISHAGAMLDSALDRYAEFVFFGGLLVYYGGYIAAQVIILAALFGSFLITYSTAKAEALQITPPRGSMKRSDRLTVLILGAAIAPLSPSWLQSTLAPPAWPVLAAAALIAVLANGSAVRRFAALCREARCRPAPEPAAGLFRPEGGEGVCTADTNGGTRAAPVQPAIRIRP